MLYHTYKQKGGWDCCDWDIPDWDWPDYDCCGEIIATIDVCDYIASGLTSIVRTIIGTPVNILINILNGIINILNVAISNIMTLITQIFNFLIQIIKQPIKIINIITAEIRIIISLMLDILGGDILSIIMVFLLPYIVYYKAVLSVIIHAIKLPIGSIINSIIGIFGVDTIISDNVSLYHLLITLKYLLILVYLCGVYGFITLVF